MQLLSALTVAYSYRCGKIPLSGCQIHHPILQGFGDAGKNAMQKTANVIRIGTSPMTPAQVLVDLWPKLQEDCPGIKFQLVPFDNTPENAREILANLGQNIDVVAGIFDETMLNLRQCEGLRFPGNPSAVQYPSTTGWPRKNG